ncbi:carboxypeptidase B-like [Panulirus ornatus]|uniref:carboxypeptidase B-like n=1 Tax=Panulirus ornatus TaxID=150431 RepID=UPI003A884A56
MTKLWAAAPSALVLLALLGWTCGLPYELYEGASLDLQNVKPVSYSGYKLFRTDVDLEELPVVDSLDTSEGVDVWSLRKNEKNFQYQIDVLTPPAAEQKVRQVFTDHNLKYQEVIGDLQSAIDMEQKDDELFAWNRPMHPMTWEKYHSVDDMNQYLEYLQGQYPNLVTVLDIGQSFENRTLHVVKVSSGPDKPAIWIDAGIHAREWIAPATAMYILHRLVEFSWEDPDLIKQFNWYIMPLVNPDGYEYSRHNDRLWRKTRSTNSKQPKCLGTDANRNFGHEWFTGGSSDDPCSLIYAGEHPFSEPETRAIRDFLMKHRKELKVYLSLHAYAQMWLLPWGHKKEHLSDYQDLYDVGKIAIQAIKNVSSTKYSIGSIPDVLYVASGSSGDFAKGVAGIRYAYTLELRDSGKYGFILPREQIEPTGIETYQGIKVMARTVYGKLFPSQYTQEAKEAGQYVREQAS